MKDPVLEPEDAGGVGGAADHPAAHAVLPRDAGRGGAQMGPQVIIHATYVVENSTKGLALVFNKRNTCSQNHPHPPRPRDCLFEVRY